MDPIFGTLMAVAGAGYGAHQAGERGKLAQREADRSLLMYEATKKRARAEESILENNLTIGAMDNTANNRDSAIAEFQNRSMQEAQAGVSGVTSGTPFYKIDSDAILNRQKLDELSTRGRLGVEGIGLQLDATKTANQAAIQQSVWQAQDALESSEYANSPFAYIMGGLTGALSGASMGNQISTLTKDVFGVTVDEAFGGAFEGLAAYNEAMDLAKTDSTPLDTAQRKLSAAPAPATPASTPSAQRVQGAYPARQAQSYRYADGSPAVSGLLDNSQVVTSRRNGSSLPAWSFGSRSISGGAGNAFTDNRLPLRMSIAEMFPVAMGYPTLGSGITPMTSGQGNTFGGVWSPLTAGAR